MRKTALIIALIIIAICNVYAVTPYFRYPLFIATGGGADTTFMYPGSLRLDSLWGTPKLFLGRVNNYGAYFSYWDSAGFFHVGDPFVIGASGPNRHKTIIDPGNEYDIELNVSGISGANYPFNFYCTEQDTAYYWSYYCKYGVAPKLYTTFPIHIYGTKNYTPTFEREWETFSIFDSNGYRRVAVFDTNKYSPIWVYDNAGIKRGYFGQRCSTQAMRADTLWGHLYGSADSLGGNPWTAYLRSDVPDTFTIIFGDTVSGKKYKLGDNTFAYFTAGNKRVGVLDSLWNNNIIPLIGARGGVSMFSDSFKMVQSALFDSINFYSSNGTPTMVFSDTSAGSSRTSGTLQFSRNLGSVFVMSRQLWNQSLFRTYSTASSGIQKNNLIDINGTADNPSIIFNDSTANLARTKSRDTLVMRDGRLQSIPLPFQSDTIIANKYVIAVRCSTNGKATMAGDTVYYGVLSSRSPAIFNVGNCKGDTIFVVMMRQGNKDVVCAWMDKGGVWHSKDKTITAGGTSIWRTPKDKYKKYLYIISILALLISVAALCLGLAIYRKLYT